MFLIAQKWEQMSLVDSGITVQWTTPSFLFFPFSFLHFRVVRLKNSVKLDISPWPMGLHDWLAGVSLAVGPTRGLWACRELSGAWCCWNSIHFLSTCCTHSFSSFLEFSMLHFLMHRLSFFLKYLYLSSLWDSFGHLWAWKVFILKYIYEYIYEIYIWIYIYIYMKSHVFCLYFQGLEQAHTFCIYLFLLTLHSRYFLILYTGFCFHFFSVVVNLVNWDAGSIPGSGRVPGKGNGNPP